MDVSRPDEFEKEELRRMPKIYGFTYVIVDCPYCQEQNEYDVTGAIGHDRVVECSGCGKQFWCVVTGESEEPDEGDEEE